MRIAFIGTGSIVQGRHLPEALREPGVEIAGFYDSKYSLAQELCAKYGGRAYESFEEMLGDEKADAALIAVPNCFHAPMSISALKAGKHVLCEKPMALNLRDAEEMLQTARDAKRVLMIAHNLHLEPAFKKAKEHLLSGKLGRVLTFYSCIGNEGPEGESKHTPWFFRSELAGYGITADGAIHMLETLVHLLEEPFVKGRSILATRDKKNAEGNLIALEDTGAYALQTQSGIIGTILTSWCLYDGWQSPLTLYCENGVLRVYPSPDLALTVTYKDGNTETMPRIPKSQWPHGSGVMHAFARGVSEGQDSTALAINGMRAVQAMQILLEDAKK